jgi:hypothetical protein
MIIAVVSFLLVCFLISTVRFNAIGKPYNGLFVILSGVLLVGIIMIKFENVAVSTPWASLENRINEVRTTQKQIVDIVNQTIELIEVQRKIPKPAIMWDHDLDDSVKHYEARINELEQRLRQLAKEE